MKNILKKNKINFLFYDYETFGTHTSLDKPAQFSSIKTDENLNIIEKPKSFYCFPSDDYLPDPSSILITGITPEYTEKNGMNEYEFSKKIHTILLKPHTCVIGYNNINFDDEITRNIFYRNFLDPYEWSWKNNNSRWDLLNIVRACYSLRPSGIKWPKNELGLPVFKLSDLTKINNIPHCNVHDATSDVYATIELAKLIKRKQPKLFNFFFKYRKKNELYNLIDLKNWAPMIYISSYFGILRNNMSCILPLSWDEDNKNILVAIDLFKDIEKLIFFCKTVSIDNISIKNLFDLGIVLIYFNRCPILAPMKSIREEDRTRLNFKTSLYDKKINLVKKNYFIIHFIKNVLLKKKKNNDSLNVDLRIYDSFFSFYDKSLIKMISLTKPNCLKNMQLNFKDARLKELFFRYKARNFFHILNKSEKKEWLCYCLETLNSFFLTGYIDKIESLLKVYSYDIKKINLLSNLLKYVFEKYKKIFFKYFNLN
ncbi:exodeoxyribonuclease I [Buchnera aphidicola]|uniref:Exodeoxyribonuclease I n=1 Tax=Buchnera aphidicola subsp. Rhopalosiphum maidis TaxID=118109 RepID=A0A3G2I5H6_BUCRM|nr:exodeoxyribonuclease I [Buchnera aphidicola]AYN24539.1 exodeoxyribonuclease I [Buchnera aphidicola (Rhopalosiphum maidis)]